MCMLSFMEDGNVTTVVQLLTTQHYKATPGTAHCAVTICVRTAWEMNVSLNAVDKIIVSLLRKLWLLVVARPRIN